MKEKEKKRLDFRDSRRKDRKGQHRIWRKDERVKARK